MENSRCPTDVDAFLETEAGRKLEVNPSCLQDEKFRSEIYREIVRKRKQQIMDEGTKEEYMRVIKKTKPSR